MKKTFLLLLLVVCIISSFTVVNASIPPDNGCPECGSLDMYGATYSYSVADGTIPCSHNLGYTDTIYKNIIIVLLHVTPVVILIGLNLY